MCKMTMKIRHVDTHRVSKEFRWTASSQNDGDKKQIYTSPKKKKAQTAFKHLISQHHVCVSFSPSTPPPPHFVHQ